MPFSYRSSLRRKLILLLTGTASLTVVLLGATLWVYQLIHDRHTLLVEAGASAQLVAESSAAALLFNDGSAANETLTELRADPRIELACLYTVEGAVLARYASSPQAAACPPSAHAGTGFTRHDLGIFRTIKAHGAPAGSLYLQVGLADMYASLLDFAETALLAALLASFFAFGLASLLQRIISGPILHLTRVAISVSEQGNYLLRAKRFPRQGRDETAVLIEQFNIMMDRIQQREAELREAHNGLEETVRVRTLDLSNEIAERKLIERDLEAARIAAEDANRAKSAFLANMSHELRTPLNAIIGYSEMLHEDAAAAGEQALVDDLSKVLISARHLLSLISDILDLSKIEAGQMRVSVVPVEAASLLADVLPSAEVLARKNKNRFHVEAEPWKGLVLVDPLRFRQCLLNLISNACKFTEGGIVTLGVHRSPATGQILWSVADTGIGIPPEDQAKLFRTFSQVDASNTRRFGGSGLGLAISQQLCQAMGGHISVQSSPGEGSTFIIHIPPCPVEAAVRSPRPALLLPAAAPVIQSQFNAPPL